MMMDMENKNDEQDANREEQRNPNPKHILNDTAIAFQSSESTLNDRWGLEIKEMILKNDYSEHILRNIENTNNDGSAISEDIMVMDMLNNHLIDMKIALMQLRKRCYNSFLCDRIRRYCFPYFKRRTYRIWMVFHR